MKCLFPGWLLLAFLACALAIAPEEIARASVNFGGREYVSAADWAKSSGYSARWLKRDDLLELVGQTHRVTLKVNSCEAQLNGVNLWLSFPVVGKNGGVYVSRLDLQTTFKPVLSPQKPRSPAKLRTICLDAGHGGKDPGYRVGGNFEKKYTLLLSEEVRQELLRAKFKVVLTRTRDTFVELGDRPQTAVKRKADLFVSLHFNAAENAQVRGSEVYCLTPAGAFSTNGRGQGGDPSRCVGNRADDRNILLAYSVQKSLVRSLGLEDRGVRRARFAVLRDASMPSILVEAGFMSHPVEGKKIFDAAYRKQLAKAIVSGIKAYQQAAGA